MTDVAVDLLERSGAGQDPRKRQQILDGARKLFQAEGFDAASMGDIARAAGVSKGTLYVYFDSKEVLFAELVREEKIRQGNAIFALDAGDHDVAAVLTRLGRAFVRFITTPKSVMSVRGVIALAHRMPELGSDFYALGPRRCTFRLGEYLRAQVDAGMLDIADVDLAAGQFLDLAQSTLSRPLLFGSRDYPTEERIDAVVDSAVRVFLKAYGRNGAAPAQDSGRHDFGA
jgi:AcrR family transcriptional regulator